MEVRTFLPTRQGDYSICYGKNILMVLSSFVKLGKLGYYNHIMVALEKVKKVINSSQGSIKGAAIIITAAVFLSRLLALIRDRLLAGSFGAGAELDIYYAAFRIPDLVFNILFAGGVMVSLLPIFSEYYKKDREEAWKVINTLLNLFVGAFLVSFLIFYLYTAEIMSSIIINFEPVAQLKAIELSRLIFISVLFFGISSIFSTILNYFNRFVAYSIAPILYNLGIILGVFFLSPYWGVYGAGAGVIFGAFSHLAIQIYPAIKCGYYYDPRIFFNHPGLKKLYRLMGPRAIAASAGQINFVIATGIAASVGVGAISVFYLSNGLRYLPVGILGISFATAAFPTFSKYWEEGKKKDFYESFKSVFMQTLYISLPVGFMMFILRDEVVALILQTGQFGSASVQITAACLGMYCISTAAQCLAPLILRGFFSLKDTLTPAIIAIIFVIMSVVLSKLFVILFQTENILTDLIRFIFQLNGTVNFELLGLVLGFNLALVFESIILLYFFYRKVGDFGIKDMIKSFTKMLISAIVMTMGCSYFLYFLNYILEPSLDSLLGVHIPTPAYMIINLLLVSSLAGFMYLQLTSSLRCSEVGYFKNYIAKKLRLKKKDGD